MPKLCISIKDEWLGPQYFEITLRPEDVSSMLLALVSLQNQPDATILLEIDSPEPKEELLSSNPHLFSRSD